jgi:two-component system cell cycle sensor histidine kinase PleC
MVNSILDLRKLEEGKFPLYLKEFEPREAVGEAIRQVQLWARQSNINLQVEFEPNVPEKMIADRWVLIRILVNLLSNALKYTPSGGTIKVKFSWMTVGFTSPSPIKDPASRKNTLTASLTGSSKLRRGRLALRLGQVWA